MKGGKQSKNKSVWDQVKNEEKDFFYTYLFKKYRGFQKKLKDIAELEELQKTKELKPEQVLKITTKDQHNEKIKELENQASIWINAKRDAEQQGSIISIETFTIILEHLSQNPELIALLSQDSESTLELAKALATKITWLPSKKDQPWKGLALQQQTVQKQEPEEQFVLEDQVQHAQYQQVQQQEFHVLTRTTPKEAVNEEPKIQQHSLQQPEETSEQSKEKQETLTLEQKETAAEQIQEQQQQVEEQKPQQREGHEHHRHQDNERRGYKQKYNNNNYDKRSYDNGPYRGATSYYRKKDRDYQQEQIWQEKTEQPADQQPQQHYNNQNEDEEYITVGHKQSKQQQQQKPQRGNYRNNDRNAYEQKGQRNQRGDNQNQVEKE